jgi:small GTP-binding protein
MTEIQKPLEKIKLIIVGESGVGKSCLMYKFTQGTFMESFITTIGIDFTTRYVELYDKKYKVFVWDTAGQEKFRSISVSYYRGSDGMLIVYDVTNRKTFECVKNWVTVCRNNSRENCNICLIGNKADLEEDRVVSYEEGKQLAEENNLFFNETSAKNGQNIDTIFGQIVKQIIDSKNKIIETELNQEKIIEQKNKVKDDKGNISLELKSIADKFEKKCCL